MTSLPTTDRRPVPSQSCRDYYAHHALVFADPRATALDTTARYVGATSTDNGRTWTPIPMPNGWTTVCGGHVEVEAASALLHGRDVVADGATRIIREGDGSLVRWTLRATS